MKKDATIITTALEHVARTAGTYADAHAWRFSAESFAELMQGLYDCGFSAFSVERVYPTLYGSLEFYAVLKKERDTGAPA